MLANRRRRNTGVPWILTHTESFGTRSEAAKRERYYKSGRGREELDNLR